VACSSPMIAAPVPGMRTQKGKEVFRFLGKASNWWHHKGKAPIKARLLPCRQCILCRLEKSRQWATRILQEIPFHDNCCFLTLTYDEKQLPVDGSLNPSHIQTFIKDLRARMDYYGKQKVKYFAVGEYGEKFQRPHYHAILFGPFGVHNHDDQRSEEEPSRSGDRQFSHSDFTATWPYGLHRFSEVTFESAAYVARYQLKKVSGADSETHYGGRHPEFQRCSQGLGKAHLQAWMSDIYPADHVVLPGRGAFLPPPYFDRLLEKVDQRLYEVVKKKRQEAHEEMTNAEWYQHVADRRMEGDVRELVTEATLIRGVL